jgi:restriction endonuclease S subunit
LTGEHSKSILDVYKNRTQIPHFSAVIPHSEIERREYLLSVGAYVEKEDKREFLNLEEINARISSVMDIQTRLREQIDKVIKDVAFYQENQLGNETFQKVTLGDVGTFIRGNGLQKADFVESGNPCIHYGQIYTHYGSVAENVISWVSEKTSSKLKKAKKGDVILTTTSENISDVCKSLAWMGDEEVSIGGHSCIFTHSLDPIFATYYFQSEFFQKQKNYYVHGTKVKDIKISDLAKVVILVPSLETQHHIGQLLFNLDQLINNVSSGLPHEISLRKQQYEFYRDTLISAAAPETNT